MIEVLRLGPDDWQRYRAIRLASLRDTPDAFWATTAGEEAQPEAWWRDRLTTEDRLTLLAVDDGVDAGTMGGGPHHEDPGDGLLYAVWVAPAARGGGAAEALIEAAIAWARQRGHRRLRLDVGDHNVRAAAFYARVGFIPTGVASTFPAPREHLTEHELALDL